MITYGDLYNFLEAELANKPFSSITNFYYTLKFCDRYNIESSRLLKVLYDFSGRNDLQVLLNVAGLIKDDTPIDKQIETPVEYAIRNNYYARFHEGMWVRCKKDDKGSIPDLNTVYQKMFNKEEE